MDRRALSAAEGEGWPPLPPAHAADDLLAGGISGWLRDEYRFWTEGSAFTREELLRRLQAAVQGNNRDRKASAGLLFLIASDIEDARFGIGLAADAGVRRPMSAWRARYKGIDRYLPPR